MYEKILLLLAFLGIVSTSLVCMIKNTVTMWALVISTIVFVGWTSLYPVTLLFLMWRICKWQKQGLVRLNEAGHWEWV